MNFCYDWLAASFDFDENGKPPCSLFRAGGFLLLTGQDAAPQTRHDEVVSRNVELRGDCSIFAREMSAQICVTLGSYLFVHNSAARKKLLREAFVTKIVDILAKSASSATDDLSKRVASDATSTVFATTATTFQEIMTRRTH